MIRQTRYGGFFLITAFPKFFREPVSGRGFLQFGRVFDKNEIGLQPRLRLVAELDGPVNRVFLQTTTQACSLAAGGLTSTRYLFKVWSQQGKGTDGVIAGHIDERYPDFIRTQLDTTIASFWPTPKWFVTTGVKRSIETWDGISRVEINNIPGPIHELASTASAVFFPYGDLYSGGVYIWTPAGGSKPFIDYGTDRNQRAANFATDGNEMVWLYASGRLPNGYEDPSTLELRAAPYTEDPETAEKTFRRVALFPYGISAYSLAIGCGYVAASRYVPGYGPGGALLVYRLSDHAAFMLPPSETPGHWQVSGVLGIHCQANGSEPEVIAKVANVREWGREGVGTYVRIPITALEEHFPFDGGR